MMMLNGQKVCPRCFCQSLDTALQQEKQRDYEQYKASEKRMVFYRESMIADQTIRDASFDTYVCECAETAENFQKARQAAADYRKGEVFTLFLAGKPGTGKSHLAYSIAKEVNEDGDKRTLFITIDQLLQRIKSTFSKDAKETEHSIIQSLIEADFLVLDDLGAELGDLNGDNKATNFINRVLFSVLEGRQGKPLIITTNLTGDKIRQAYDDRSVSRMFRGFRHIKFKTAKDKRMIEIPF